MDISAAAEWSSGCESGWTSYLDESSGYPNTQWPQTSMNFHSNIDQTRYKQEYEEEEDLSMVSDASSGPATAVAATNNFLQLDQDDEYSYDHHQSRYNNFYSTHSSSSSSRKLQTNEMKKKVKGKLEGKQQQQHSNFLDDTASSPAAEAMTYSKRYVTPSNNQEPASIDHHLWGFSQNFSTTQGNPAAMYNHFSGHWQTSYPKDSDPAEPSSFRGGSW